MTKQRAKHSTWCGVPLELYRRKKAELSRKDFAVWWAKKTGRPVDVRGTTKNFTDTVVNQNQRHTDQLALWLDQLKDARHNVRMLERTLEDKMEYIRKLENRSWIQRLFNLKG